MLRLASFFRAVLPNFGFWRYSKYYLLHSTCPVNGVRFLELSLSKDSMFDPLAENSATDKPHQALFWIPQHLPSRVKRLK